MFGPSLTLKLMLILLAFGQPDLAQRVASGTQGMKT